MKLPALLRLISLLMLAAAIVFALSMMACPTCGQVFYIGCIRIDHIVLRFFYRLYIVVMAALFGASFLVRKKKD